MELYFLRHGEAEPTSAANSDADRALTECGRSEVRTVAELAKRAGMRPEAIYTSPLLRARQTGEILEEIFAVPTATAQPLASGPSLGDLQDFVSKSGRQRILLVGHEPHMSATVRTLTGGRVKMRTATLAYVRAELLEPLQASLWYLLGPPLLPSTGGDRPA